MSIAETHQNYSHDWWTPEPWLDWVRRTIGSNYYDPCPGNWNPDWPSGLEAKWRDPSYCNHPGSRGSTAKWWKKACHEMQENEIELIWCAFNCEQLRHMYPPPFKLSGYLIMPRDRIPFIWGGPDIIPEKGKPRFHGKPMKSPGNWTVFWSTVAPARLPQECVIIKTGSLYV